jgi:adenylate kinase
MRIVLLGPPSVGKELQARRISERFGIPHLSTDDMLRSAVQSRTSVGPRARQIMTDGGMVPDGFVVVAVIDRIGRADAKRGFVLDGFPRTIAQAMAFDDVLRRNALELDRVIELRADDDILLERIEKQHAREADTSSDGLRLDDSRETIRGRLDSYHQQTIPLVEYYRSKRILRTVDGLQEVDDVTQDVLRALGDQ